MNKIYMVKYISNIAADLVSLPLRAHRFILRRSYKDNKAGSLSPSPSRGGVKKILLMKMWGIGNITILLPILKKTKEKHRDAEIYFLTFGSNRGLLENSSYISRIFYFPLTANFFRILFYFIKYAATFNKLKIDLLMNFEQCNRVSIIFSYITGAKIRIGFEIEKCNYNSLYTETVKNDSLLHVSQNLVNLARKADIDIDRYEYIPPEVDPHSKENVKKILARFNLENKTIVGLHAGSGENFTGKRWRNTNFARLADRLIERHGVTIVYTGTERERRLIEDTVSKMKFKAVNLCGRFKLQELAEFLRHCYLFISNDTGPLHIAVSLGINTVGLYGPMNPRQYGALNNNSLSFYKPIGCNPCLTDLNNKTSLCKEPRCLDKITVEEVMEKISQKFFKREETTIEIGKWI